MSYDPLFQRLSTKVPEIEEPRNIAGAAGRPSAQLARHRLAHSKTQFSRGCPKKKKKARLVLEMIFFRTPLQTRESLLHIMSAITLAE